MRTSPLAKTLEVPIGAPLQRLMLLIHDRRSNGMPFPSVDEVAEARVVANRGAARNLYTDLEDAGLARRDGHGWKTASFTPVGERVAVQIAAQRQLVPAKGHRQAPKLWRPDNGMVSMHQQSVQPIEEGVNPFRDGRSIAKLSANGFVTKGRLKGARVWYLTLEERKTCPTTCAMLAKCYGDTMVRAVRWQHGDHLEGAIGAQLAKWHQRPRPMLFRLHELGDFYSPAYVARWSQWLGQYDWLNVFGYTAWTPDTPVGGAIAAAKLAHGDRFAIRWSGSTGIDGSAVYAPSDSPPDGTFACPEQTGRVSNCSACGACWSTSKGVAFREH